MLMPRDAAGDERGIGGDALEADRQWISVLGTLSTAYNGIIRQNCGCMRRLNPACKRRICVDLQDQEGSGFINGFYIYK